MGENRRSVSNKIVAAAVALALVLFALGLWYRTVPETSAPLPSAALGAFLQVEVMDAITGSPIGGAVVVIPETGKSYQTTADGVTELIAISGGETALEQPWLEASVLVYKEGYVPYAIFHAKAAGERKGPRVYLFPEASVQNAQPFSVTEGPPREWVNALVEKYRP